MVERTKMYSVTKALSMKTSLQLMAVIIRLLIFQRGLPFPPRNVMMTAVENETTSVTVNINWDPPNGGGAVDNYTVIIATDSAEHIVTFIRETNTTFNYTLFYNVRYVVRVQAENCRGSSTPAVTDSIELVNCFAPTPNPNVTIKPYQATTEGSIISYQCRPGFIPEGRLMSMCGGDGRWNPDPENCTEVNCNAPSLPVNSSVLHASRNSTSTRLGSEVTFQCNYGLFPSREITTICTSEQRWSPDPQGIECRDQPVFCKHPNNPTNGFLSAHDHKVTSNETTLTPNASILTFGCNEGYLPQGTVTAECVSTNIWVPDPAQLVCVLEVLHLETDHEIGWRNQSTLTEARDKSSILIVVTITIAVTCSVVCYIGGVFSGLLISRCKRTHKKVSTSHRPGINEQPSPSPSPFPVYEEVTPTSGSGKTEIELQENAAYHPLVRNK